MLATTLVTAVAVAVLMSGTAGARRNQTAFDRFLESTRAASMLVSADGEGFDYSVLEDIPGVEMAAPLVGIELYPALDAKPFDVLGIGSVDGRYGWDVERPKVLAGRLPDHGADEIFVSRRYAEAFDVGAGDTIRLVAETDPEAVARARSGDPDVVTFDVEVAGVGVFTSDLVPATELDSNPTMLVSESLTARVLGAAKGITGFDGAAVSLEDGTSVEDVAEAAEVAAERQGASLFVLDAAGSATMVRRALGPQATALWVFVAVLGMATALLVGHAVTRHVALASDRFGALRAIGIGRRQIVGLVAMEAAMMTAAALLVAWPIATVGSWAFPVGRARLAEPDPGVAVNLAAFAAVGVGAGFVSVLAACVTVARALRRVEGSSGTRSSRVATAAAALGASPPAMIGLRRAFEATRGASAVPVRSGTIGATIAVAGVLAAATFASGLDALVSEPARYGQTWTVAMDAQFGPTPAGDLVDRYRNDPRVEAMAGLRYGELLVDGEPVAGVGVDAITGALSPTIVEGRAPTDGEIVLGSETMQRLDVSVGDEVSVDAGTGAHSLRVAGRAVFPKLSQGSFNILGLGTGAWTTTNVYPDQFDRAFLQEGADAGELPPPMSVDDFLVDERSYNAVLFLVDAGHEAAVLAELERHPMIEFGGGFVTVFVDQQPSAISTYDEIRAIPAGLAAILAVLGGGLVVTVLLTSVRRRRFELGVCRSLGMAGAEVAAIVRWQATAVALAAVVFGTPLGLAAGRTAWRMFADELGVPTANDVPWAVVAAVAATTVLVTNVAGAWPARRVRRLSAAATLRAE